MIDHLKQFFKIKEIREIQLAFEVEYKGGNDLQIFVYFVLYNDRKKVTDFHNIGEYGHPVILDDHRYMISMGSQETLASILSQSPIIQKDGTLIMEINPSILAFMRSRQGFQESENSKKLMISKKPLKPAISIDLQKKEGLIVDGGYTHEDMPEMIPSREIDLAKDGRHIKVGNHFYPLPTGVDRKKQQYVDMNRKQIPKNAIPEFFTRDLVLLESDFTAILSESAQEIEVREDEFKPHIKVSLVEGGWLDFEIEHGDQKYRIPHDELWKGRQIGEEKGEDIEKGKGENGEGRAEEEGKWGNGELGVESERDYNEEGMGRRKEDFEQVDELSWIKVDQGSLGEVQKALEGMEAVRTETGYRIQITEFASLEEFVEQIGGIKEVTEEYDEFLENITDFSMNADFMLPQEMETQLLSAGIELRGYQRQGIHWLDWLMDHHLHGLLADDMGLGKTIQSILAMLLNIRQGGEGSGRPNLVICPKSVIRHWTREIKRCDPEMRVYEYIGEDRDSEVFRGSIRNHGEESMGETGLHDVEKRENDSDNKSPIVIISSYATITRDIEIVQDVPLNYLMLDEATKIKNPGAKRSKAIKRINSVHRIAITGTPIENRLSELWSIFDFLMKGHLGTFRGFTRHFGDPIEEGDGEAATRLARRIRPFMLRRMKEEVEEELPEKIDVLEFCELTEEQRVMYAQIQENQVAPIRTALEVGERVNFAMNILPILTKLKQVCDHPALLTSRKGTDPEGKKDASVESIMGRSKKFDRITRKIMEIQRGDDQMVLFSHFLAMLDLFEQVLTENGIPYMRVDGSTQNRQWYFDQFNDGKYCVALLSIQACGHGVNLTGANHVIHVDRWWNPAVEDQATDRVHRIGQEKSVYVHRIITKGTLEERIHELLEKKRLLADKVIGAALQEKMEWSKEDLIDLLRPFDSGVHSDNK